MARSFVTSTHTAQNGTATAVPINQGTISIWVKPNFNNDPGTIPFMYINRDATLTKWNGLFIYNGNINYGWGASTVAIGTTNFQSGIWANWITIWDSTLGAASYQKLYKNANLLGTYNGGLGGQITTTTRLEIGNDQYEPQNRPANSSLADYAVWNVILTANEMSALASGVRPFNIRPAAITAFYPLDGLESPEPDLSSAQKNLTLIGSVLANGPPVTIFTPRWPRNIDPAASTLSQKHFRFRTDADAVDTMPIWGANEDVNA